MAHDGSTAGETSTDLARISRSGSRSPREFQIICEIEPALGPSLMSVRHQVDVLAGVSTAILIPDNHLGRATVSSIAAAHEVVQMGSTPIACINSRDRNRLGFQRDLLTAAAYDVHELLLVFGDRPASGGTEHDLTAATMLADARAFNAAHRDETPPFLLGVTTRLARLPAWKLDSDMLFVQVGFDVARLVEWRQSVSFRGPVYAGVLVLSSAAMARALMKRTPEITVPEHIINRLEKDPCFGVDFALEQVAAVAASGLFEGVHLISVGRYRDVAIGLAAHAGILTRVCDPLGDAPRNLDDSASNTVTPVSARA